MSQLFGKVFPELPLTMFRWKVETCVSQAQRRLAIGETLHDFLDVTLNFCSVGPICDGIGIHEADITGDMDDLKLKIAGSDEPVILTNNLVNEIAQFARKRKFTIARQNVIFEALGANPMSDKEFKEVIEDIKSTYSRTIKSKSRKGADGLSEFEIFCKGLSRLVKKDGANNTCSISHHDTGSQQTCSALLANANENQPRTLELEGVRHVRSTPTSDQMKLMHMGREMRILKGELAERTGS